MNTSCFIPPCDDLHQRSMTALTATRNRHILRAAFGITDLGLDEAASDCIMG